MNKHEIKFLNNKMYFKIKSNGTLRILKKDRYGYNVYSTKFNVYCHTGDFKSLQETYPTVFNNITKDELDKQLGE